MAKLTDTQVILLSTAAQGDEGSVLHYPASIAPGGVASRAVASPGADWQRGATHGTLLRSPNRC